MQKLQEDQNSPTVGVALTTMSCPNKDISVTLYSCKPTRLNMRNESSEFKGQGWLSSIMLWLDQMYSELNICSETFVLVGQILLLLVFINNML